MRVVRLVLTARTAQQPVKFEFDEPQNCDATCLGNVVFRGNRQELHLSPLQVANICQFCPIVVAEFSLLFMKLDFNQLCWEAGDTAEADVKDKLSHIAAAKAEGVPHLISRILQASDSSICSCAGPAFNEQWLPVHHDT